MTGSLPPEDDKDICEVGGEGLVLPLFGDDENRWPAGLRGVLYLIGLGWCFLGVALISDVFLGAIERITSKKVRKLNPKTNRYVTHMVWNPTVANLSLMALGSSAPEILLSVIELLGNDMFAGKLGPSTIVGSAAFNLLMITAVCVSAIPQGELRVIKEVPVYMITASFSVFAYLWLIFILEVTSPDVVEPAEGVITFLYFPLMIGLAYMADVGFFSKGGKDQHSHRGSVISNETSKEELAELELKIRQRHGETLSDEMMKKILTAEAGAGMTRANYRVNAIRGLTGGRRVQVTQLTRSMSGKFQRGMSNSFNKLVGSPTNNTKKVVPLEEAENEEKIVFNFPVLQYAVLENAGEAKLAVRREGGIFCEAKVGIRTREGTAKEATDFHAMKEYLDFAPGEVEKKVTIQIVDDTAYEEDENFYVDLYDPSVVSQGMGPPISAKLGEIKTVTVVIIDDDLPGVLQFPDEDEHGEKLKDKDLKVVTEKAHDQEVDITVQRKNGGTGKVSCKYATESDSAVSPLDFEAVEGVVEFNDGETAQKIKLTVKARGRYDRADSFRLILSETTGGAKFPEDCDGGPDQCILTIQIKSEQQAKDRIDRMMSTINGNWERAKLGHSSWKEQFTSALYVNGGEDEDVPEGEEAGGPSWMDYVMHAITLPWKLFFALVPPVEYCGGWVCFCCSLGMIGIVTAVIGDMAALLGCVMTVPKEVTAITFVALGTSLPDTFASKTAAVQDEYADASVGNVTGSNSVNVFLGLGLPWMIGSIYWKAQKPTEAWLEDFAGYSKIKSSWDCDSAVFVVKAGTLTPSVIVFSACAITTILILYIRHLFGHRDRCQEER
jgi:solute carrier family 8 (sodium/calcium exchanger)